MDQSEDVYGSEADLREFFERGISALGGDVEKAGNNLFRAELPESLRRSRDEDPTAPFTFNREFAMDHEGIGVHLPRCGTGPRAYAASAGQRVGYVGIKPLPFVDDPGITYNYRVRVRGRTGEGFARRSFRCSSTRHTETPTTTRPASHRGDSTHQSSLEEGRVRLLLEHEREIRTSADRYISQRVESPRDELQQRRRRGDAGRNWMTLKPTKAERERIETFIADYERKAEAGTDMDIAI